MSISSNDDEKSVSIHSDSDDSRDDDRGRDSSPEVGPTKGKGKKAGKGRARKPPTRKTTTGNYLKLTGSCIGMSRNGIG